MRIRVGADTPFGVVFRDFKTEGGGLIVTERVQRSFALAEGFAIDEIELLTIEDLGQSKIIWTAPDKPGVGPTTVEIRAAQEASIAEVEEQLAAGNPTILIEGREISRETAWAVSQAIRKSFELGGLYDGQEQLGDGTWLAHVQVPIGRFEG